jgi:2-phosphosulfolactate phosphatase
MTLYYDQTEYDTRCEWGLQGLYHVGNLADVLIIVDTLSFSTCVDVAVSRGAFIIPSDTSGLDVRDFSRQIDAEWAVPRGHSGRFSLSPISMKNAERGIRIVLPSPNGSRLSVEAAKTERLVVAGCLRNCRAVARFAEAHGRSIAVIAAGERWPDGTLRPAAEDLVAAGAIISHLSGTHSPESALATAAWNSVRSHVGDFLNGCSSGRELIERGYAEDVQVAAEVNSSEIVPLYRDHAYGAAS